MVDITQEVQNELDSILETYSGSRIPRENGASAFQNWWWQVQTHIQNLDKSQIDKPDGINLPYEIPYWGDIKYSKYTIGQDIFILVTYIKFNETNFFQFIKYHRYSKKGEPVIVGDLNFNYKLIKVQGSRLYGIMTPYDEVLIKPCYDRIIPFYHCSENFNRIHAIGIKNGRCYAIDLDGNTEKLSMDSKELMSVGCRHHHDLDESKLKKNIIIENNATNKLKNMNNTKKVVRLTESQLHNIIAESVSQILMELDPRTYASAAQKRMQQAEYQDKAKGNEEKAADLFKRSRKLQNAAIDSYNNQFGSSFKNGDKEVRMTPMAHHHDEHISLDDYDRYRDDINYVVNTRRMKQSPIQKLFGGSKYYSDEEYSPKSGNVYKYERKGKNDPTRTTTNTRNWYKPGGSEENNIAWQMQHGTGNYIKGRGWR